MQIQPFIQAYVEAIASILEVAVTIVDNEMVRVAGTGYHCNQVGNKVSQDSFFKTVLDRGEAGAIKDVLNESTCLQCRDRQRCRELANLAYPIFKEQIPVGVIALTAFSQREKENLLKYHKRLNEFLKYMSVLLESKLMTEEVNQRLEKQIFCIMSMKNEQNEKFIGQSKAAVDVMKLIAKVAPSDSTIMLRGESGTGKDVLAKIIHSMSPYKDNVMVCVNCAAIPENLVESELFGYEEGAFTGAKKHGHTGKFELANNSTIFLDEIGDMPMAVQTKLLRVLQENCIEKIGGRVPIPIHVRIICATHRNLEEMVAQKLFRQDLYYRLNVIPIHIPPLRERKEDISSLIEYFIGYYNKKLHKNVVGISKGAKDILTNYPWPGNVRELKNMIEYLANIVGEGRIKSADLPDNFAINRNFAQSNKTLKELLENYEQKILFHFLEQADTSEKKTAMAQQLGISRATLYRKLSQYGLERYYSQK